MKQEQQQQQPRPPVMTIAQTERALSISRSTVNRWVKEGKLTKVVLGYGSVRITTDSVYTLIGMA
jgi:excisionase family DNA binding protein